uniref:Uncharacterized protein n=1 Tax=Mustela putorius furo TaxID=9669 RepID=M3Z890_MUSPF
MGCFFRKTLRKQENNSKWGGRNGESGNNEIKLLSEPKSVLQKVSDKRLLIAACTPFSFPQKASLMWIFRDCVLGVLGQEEVDACRARHVHRNAAPESPGQSFPRLCQLSKCIPDIRSVLSPAPDGGARRGRPYEGMRPRAPATHHPAAQARASSSLQTAPKPRTLPSRQRRGPAAGASGRKAHRVSPLVCHLQRPRRRGHCAQFPRPGRPQAVQGCCARAHSVARGGFSPTFLPHHLSSGLIKKRNPPTSSHSHTLHTSTWPILERWGDLSDGENLSESVEHSGQQPAPTPTLGSNDPQPRAFRKASRLAGGQGGPQRRAGGAERHSRLRGRFQLCSRFAKSTPANLSTRIPSCPARRTGAGKKWGNVGPGA